MCGVITPYFFVFMANTLNSEVKNVVWKLMAKLKTVKEISEPLLGMKPARTYDLIRKGIIPLGVVVYFGKRQIRINETKLLEWLEKGGFSLCKTEEAQ